MFIYFWHILQKDISIITHKVKVVQPCTKGFCDIKIDGKGNLKATKNKRVLTSNGFFCLPFFEN
jgi:hypothetical protein